MKFKINFTDWKFSTLTKLLLLSCLPCIYPPAFLHIHSCSSMTSFLLSFPHLRNLYLSFSANHNPQGHLMKVYSCSSLWDYKDKEGMVLSSRRLESSWGSRSKQTIKYRVRGLVYRGNTKVYWEEAGVIYDTWVATGLLKVWWERTVWKCWVWPKARFRNLLGRYDLRDGEMWQIGGYRGWLMLMKSE